MFCSQNSSVPWPEQSSETVEQLFSQLAEIMNIRITCAIGTTFACIKSTTASFAVTKQQEERTNVYQGDSMIFRTQAWNT